MMIEEIIIFLNVFLRKTMKIVGWSKSAGGNNVSIE